MYWCGRTMRLDILVTLPCFPIVKDIPTIVQITRQLIQFSGKPAVESSRKQSRFPVLSFSKVFSLPPARIAKFTRQHLSYPYASVPAGSWGIETLVLV